MPMTARAVTAGRMAACSNGWTAPTFREPRTRSAAPVIPFPHDREQLTSCGRPVVGTVEQRDVPPAGRLKRSQHDAAVLHRFDLRPVAERGADAGDHVLEPRGAVVGLDRDAGDHAVVGEEGVDLGASPGALCRQYEWHVAELRRGDRAGRRTGWARDDRFLVEQRHRAQRRWRRMIGDPEIGVAGYDEFRDGDGIGDGADADTKLELRVA